ncbi:hypothetical protein [Streptomyces sp. CB03238]|uniref:hypothetical protein n=1 Tax=Streptomyces sp. CB03238 TaxID=1907777 RepID=UPI000A11A45A|nr:hypothetical protein [Streptomyces sp. CB03238]ORT59413.1 hypothetical protein BKD26_15655 [Streptomyces sp. CB03238]
MSENQPVNPAEVPVFTGNLELLDEKVKALSGAGGKIATAAGDVHSSFGGLSAFYKAPEADQLFATTQPVKDKALTISSDLCTIAGALGTYASDIRPLKQKLDELRQDAVTFRQKIAEDDKWREDGDLVEENNDRRNEIAEVWTQFQAAERAAHAKIVALVGGKALKVNDGSNGEGMYGYDAEALKQAKSLPWGDAVEESTPWWQVWEHAYDFGKGVIVDGVWGTIKGLGTLVGFQGWEAAGQAWKGLGLLATGLVISATPLAAVYWTADDKHLPGWIRDSRTAMKETGKALVAWDQWGSNPARAAGAVTFNVLTTVFTGGAGGAVSGAGKAGAAARAISFAGKAGRAIDPTTYLFKGAGAGITKIGDVMTGLKGMGNIDLPPIPEGTVVLPEGSLMRPDGTVHLPDGAPVPEGAIEVPSNTVRLPESTPIPPGVVDLGDGVVKLPDDTPAPAGSTPLQEGTVALPKDTPAVPADATPLPVKDGDPPQYLDGKGNILDENGKVVSDVKNAPKDVVDRGTDPDATPTTGADNPRVDTPAKVPAMAGAAVHAGDNTAISLGNSLDNNLGDVGRVGDDAPVRVPDTPGGLADNMPAAQAGNNLPGGGAGDHLPTNNLDNTPSTGGSRDVPPTGGHTDTPSTGGGSRDVPPGGSTADNGVPGGTGADNGIPSSGLPDTPGAGALDDAAAGADDAARAGDDGTTPAGHGASTPPRVERPDFMREDGNPYGERGSLTLQQIEEIQVYRANEEPGYFERHYRKDGTRKSLERYDESGYTPPQLTRLSEDAPWIRAKDAPAPPKPHFLDEDYIRVGADTVTSPTRLKILEEAAQNRHFAIQWDNLVADWKAEAGRTHAAQGTLESAGLWGEAKGAYKESHTEMGDAAEAFGEKAAEHHFIAERYPDFDRQPLLGPKNGNDQFDQVWKHEDGRVVVIEAKSSPGTELGSRALPGGKRVSQGSREYFFDIIEHMRKRGEFEVVEALEKALNDGKLEYVVVKGEKNSGTYTGYQYRRFDISKGTLP